MPSNKRKINIHTFFDSKRVLDKNNTLNTKYTNIGSNKNSAYETFTWMKNQNKNKNKKNLSKSMTSFNLTKQKI